MITQLFTVLILFLIVFLVGVGLLFLTSLLGPKLPQSRQKLMPYECGVPGQEAESTKIPVKYYLTAILFILFDIEIVFMYPWALVFVDYIRQGAGTFIFIEMLTFMAILVFGLFYIWKGKALQWE